MAGLPPETIQVKRKRLERSKRSRSGDGRWVYQRKQVDVEHVSIAAETSAPATPIIQPTREGDEDRRLIRHPHQPTKASVLDDGTTTKAVPEPPAAPEEPTPTITSHPSIRRFHLSRSNSPQPTGGVSKKRTVPAVFVERGAKKQRETLKAIIQEHNVTSTGPPKPQGDSQSETRLSSTDEESAATEQPNPVKYKRPGARAATTAPKTKPTLPPSMRDRENSNMDELARVMDSWTIDEITKNLERMEEQSTKSKYSPAKSRFKPKAPKLRYHERHPEYLAEKQREAAAHHTGTPAAVMDVDGMDTSDDEDYVVETYERVPAERLRDQAVPAHRVGLLVFDTEPDMADFFYGNESDSEDEFPEDEEDENAENYYAADYPDEDLDWDDEFDRNAYHYVNQNASDMEEFDERDFVDDVWERSDEKGGRVPL
ncbi:hypothetical protein NEMBOFW57_000529 [Staphylotrichum longicolle]|uniref:Transcription factor Iwr1 domain-containing protein n=1 Tax=Staphylotrichum longicolle TaxID=669026 RepID=A0AAD4EZY0_9PEZI|nr:hypothetical protein NEMBOFW57_000529 [Staphylotrichum longicolle]